MILLVQSFTARMHLTPGRRPRQHPTTLFFTDRLPFLPPSQERQSTEGNMFCYKLWQKPKGQFKLVKTSV